LNYRTRREASEEGARVEVTMAPREWGLRRGCLLCNGGRIWEGGSPENVLIFELIMVYSGRQFLQFGCCFTRKITKLLVDKDGP